MAKDSTYFNHEGYYDPTAGEAITNADKEDKPKDKPIPDKTKAAT